MLYARDIMTKKVICVDIDTSLVRAVNILLRNNFNGLPVLDKDNKLVGILTEYDMIVKGSSIHLPTLIKLFSEFELYKKDENLIKGDLRKIFETKVGAVMNSEPITFSEGSSMEEMVKTFEEHHRVNPIPVLDSNKKVVGIISRSDIIKPLNLLSIDFSESSNKELSKNINKFLNNFDSNFTAVSKTRTRYWLLVSLLFTMVGFFIAWFFIIRIAIK